MQCLLPHVSHSLHPDRGSTPMATVTDTIETEKFRKNEHSDIKPHDELKERESKFGACKKRTVALFSIEDTFPNNGPQTTPYKVK